MLSLPIDSHLPEILGRLEKSPNLILQAPPGTGKTTRVPVAMLGTSFCQGREVWILEPRRLAARMAARRVAEELGESVGKTVGYHFRFENVGGPQTRLRFLTEGMLVRRMQSDPRLQGVAAVVLDEFHERHLQGDIALSLLRRLQRTDRSDLRLVVMSATLFGKELQVFLDSADRLDIQAKHFPLEVFYRPSKTETPLETQVARAVKECLDPKYPPNDILVFLPGMADIRRAENALLPIAKQHSISLHSLHGDLSKDEQDRAVLPGDQRKVVLSTNLAESSLTIEGVGIVIDSGLHRQASNSSWSGMPSLRTRPISKASAIQRAGRAARTGPGLCIRLYTDGDFDHRPAEDTPEIRRTDLSHTLLELKSLGVQDEDGFDWFENPGASALNTARALLFKLGALASAEPGAALTTLGKKMAGYPAHPRLARLLDRGQELGCPESAARLAALISEGALEGLDALESVRRQPPPQRALEQFLRSLAKGRGDRETPETLALAALSAFPDRVGKLRAASRSELVLSSGGSVRTDDLSGFSKASLFVVLEAKETQSPGQARGVVRATSLIAMEPEWLFDLKPMGVEESTTHQWDAAAKRVVCRTKLKYDQLVLEELEGSVSEDAAVDVVLRSLLGTTADSLEKTQDITWIETLSPLADKELLESIFARKLLARDHYPGASPVSTGLLVKEALKGRLRLEDLKQIDWEQALLPDKLRRAFPSHVTLPGGRKTRVGYALGRPPWIESRLQDFFGMKDGPRIIDGKVPLTLHLLAPNHRAVQVTTDLAGFWTNTYPTLRRELSRNYPKHSWPEDPLRATPPKPKPRRG